MRHISDKNRVKGEHIMVWTPLFSLALLASVFAIGDCVAKKTKGLISSLVVSSIVYLIGFLSGIIPMDSIENTGLTALMSSVGIGLVITSLGTSIKIGDFIREWKTVLIALCGLIGLAGVCFLVGPIFFGREYSIAAASPISGGAIAAIIAQSAALEAGREDIGAYVMLLLALQQLIGIPTASFILRKRMKQMGRKGDFANSIDIKKVGAEEKRKPWEFSSKSGGSNFYIAKLAIVAAAAGLVANLTIIPKSSPTNYILNPNIAYLIFGLLFAHMGFLERDLTTKSQSFGILMLALCALVPASLTVSGKDVLSMLFPIVGMLVFGAIGLGIGGLLCGKILKYDIGVSSALALCAMIGYPATQIISNEIVENMDLTEKEKKVALDYLLPKMLISGFTSVTIASVVFASIVCKYIF